MKKSLLFILTALVTLFVFSTSCSRFNLYTESETPYHYANLKGITQMINDDPETALERLEELENSPEINNFSEAEFYEYHILLAEARYKSDLIAVNERFVNEAVLYFDSLTKLYPKNNEILFQNARAHYYKGVCKEETEQYKEAFSNYLESLNLIENINIFNGKNDDINHFKALTFVRISDILYWLDAYSPAIECLNNANILFNNEKNYMAMARNNIIIAIMYAQNHDYQIALRHLSVADSIATECYEDSLIKNEVVRISSTIMYNLGYHDEPFDIMLKQFNSLKAGSQRMEVAGVLGDIYYDLGILDSAIYYYEHYFPDNKFSKIDAANHIVEIALKTNNNELLAKYAPILNKETNNELMLSKIKTEITSMYEQYKIERHNNYLYNRIMVCLAIILLSTILFFVLGMFLLKLKNNKYNNEINEKKFYINSLQEKIDKKSSENKHIKQKIKYLESELHDIKTKKYLTHAPFDMKLKKLIESSMCKRLVDISHDNSIKTNMQYPDLILSESEKKELIDLFNKTFDNALSRIVSDHEGLKYDDILYFCLELIGMDEKHISAVTGKSYNIIYNRLKKIQNILGTDKTIRESLRDLIV